MAKHHAYLQLYPKLVWMVISSKTIKEQMFTSKSEPSKAQPTLQKSSGQVESRTYTYCSQILRWREGLVFLPAETIH